MTKNLPLLLVISLITGCVEVDISVPSFPDISNYFKISDGLTQMTIALTSLVSAYQVCSTAHYLILLADAKL